MLSCYLLTGVSCSAISTNEAVDRRDEHWNLYYLLEQDQKEHPMPELWRLKVLTAIIPQPRVNAQE